MQGASAALPGLVALARSTFGEWPGLGVLGTLNCSHVPMEGHRAAWVDLVHWCHTADLLLLRPSAGATSAISMGLQVLPQPCQQPASF